MARSERQKSGGRTKSKASVKKVKKVKKKATPRTQEREALSRKRRLEVLGLVLIAVSILLTLALVSYNPSDNPLARAFRLESAFNPAMPSVANIMGLIGAYIAWLSVPNLLGYPVIGIPLLVLALGWFTFRDKPLQPFLKLSILMLVGVVLVATFFGWLSPEYQPTLWSGTVGAFLAEVSSHAIGRIGTVIVLGLLALIVARLSIDADLNEPIEWIQSQFGRLSTWGRRRVNQFSETRAEAARKREAERKTRLEMERTAKAARPDAGEPVRRRLQEELKPDDSPLVTLNDQFKTQATPESLGTSKDGAAGLSSGSAHSGPQGDGTAADPETAGDVSLHVRERVEEEKVNLDDRRAEATVSDIKYKFPSVDLLEDDSESRPPIDYNELEENKQILLDKLETYNIEITNIDAVVGPTVTLYELTPAPGVKISRIKSLEDDLAMAMAARGIRMIAPIPGKSAIGVEIPNRYRELVQVSSVLNTARFRDADMALPVAIGKTIEGEVFVGDLTKMPHLLIAGATGSGKSVGLNNLIANLLYACHPEDLKFVMIDPKRIELQQYARIFDHFIAMPEGGEDPITTDFTDAAGVLHSCLKEMEIRYDLLSDAGVRTIREYNKRFDDGRVKESDDDDIEHKHLPYIVVVIDELADLMMTAGKEVEGPIARLAQMARAVGIHLVVATQRPSVNVITGLIKANFSSRIAFQVASGVDSRTIIDQYGAEQLVGNGDLLYMSGSKLIRLQSPFISLDEIEAITTFIADQPGSGPYILPEIEKESDEGGILDDADLDPLFKDAARAIVRSQQGSVSLLQRKLSVGYARAARIVDQLENAGVVGPFEGSKARQVLIPDEIHLDQFFNEREEESA